MIGMEGRWTVREVQGGAPLASDLCGLLNEYEGDNWAEEVPEVYEYADPRYLGIDCPLECGVVCKDGFACYWSEGKQSWVWVRQFQHPIN